VEYFSINDAARIIGVSEKTVRKWISQGRLKTVLVAAHQLSGKVRPAPGAVMALTSAQVERERSRLAQANQDQQELSGEIEPRETMTNHEF
jgi:excisionase family DNA binding protein